MTIEGEPLKPYRLYRTGLNDEIIEMVAEADTIERFALTRGDLIGAMRSITTASEWINRIYAPLGGFLSGPRAVVS
jgi:hypothetical protein